MLGVALIALYLLVMAAVIFGVFQFTAWMRTYRMRKTAQVPPGFRLTSEIYYDPTSGKKQRVWYNDKTGERFYETVE